ncbi:MAG: S8 family serine peptidase [Acidobacteria bacterium]|nr:S8 family serine peptidase [Acidobacteriota bacterium]
MKRLVLVFLVIGVLGASVPFNFNTVDAQSSPEKGGQKSLREANFEYLIKRVSQGGQIRVIVGLKFPFSVGDNDFVRNVDARKQEIAEIQNDFLNKLVSTNVSVLKYQYIPYLVIKADVESLHQMKEMSEVLSIEEDIALQPALSESVNMIGGIASWNAGYTGSGQTVAIIDSGVDKTHPMFQGKIVSEACYSAYDNTTAFATCSGNFGPNPTPGPGEPDFIVRSTATNSGLPCNPQGWPSLIVECAHGTHVAGIAAGRTPTFSGVARDASIIAINASSIVPDGAEYKTNFYNSALILSLERVFELRTSFNIASVNMSLGGSQGFTANCDAVSPAMKNAIDNLRTFGIATVISAGNSGFVNAISYPACISSAVSVGRVGDGSGGDTFDQVHFSSNSASFLNLLAPGGVITSSVPSFLDVSGYSNMSGTSQAAPHVAGSWALMKQRNTAGSVSQVLTTLVNTGIPILDSRNGITKPRIRVDRALSIFGATCVVNTITVGQTTSGQSLQISDCSFSDSLNRYFDYYVFDALAGQQIAISMNAAFDTYISLRNSGGQILIEDNNGGNGTNSRIPAGAGFFTIPATGTYIILATSNPNLTTGAYTLSLHGNCSYSLTQYSQSFPASGGNGSTNVIASSGCPWSATSNAGWITVTSGSSGNGNGGVNFSVAANSGATRSGTITAAGQTLTIVQSGAVSRQTPFDFDGDGKTDVSVFRPVGGSGSEWWYLRSSDGGNRAFAFGEATDTIVPADFTGDGKTDLAFWRPASGEWFVLRSEDSTFFAFPFGAAGDVPSPADFDGDGKSDATVYRPSTNTWFTLRSSDGQVAATPFGTAGDKPVPGDYDGDGKADVAIFRPTGGSGGGEWWYLRSSDGANRAFAFGSATDLAVPGDYTGDGKADIAYFRPTTGEWFILRSEDSSFFAFPWGASGDLPAPGDYDGDGRIDAAVFRPSNSNWFALRSTAGPLILQFGTTGDRPLPNAFVR